MSRILRRRAAVLTAALLFLTALLSACGSSQPDSPTPQTTPATSVSESNATTPTSSSGLLSDIPLSMATSVTSSEATSEAPTDTTVATDPVQPMSVNLLTGLPTTTSERQNKRPVAVAYNNLRRALPQHGIGSADIVFEVEAEGGVTRLLAVFSDISTVGTIGSVRSARPVMVHIALGLDCVFAHSGGSPQAYQDISTYSLSHIDGLYDNGSVYYRDAGRQQSMGIEHSLMTNGTRLQSKLQKMESSGTRMTLKSGYTAPLAFNERDVQPTNGTPAQKITTKYGSYQPFFRYDASAATYQRYEYGAKHIDQATGEQLTFKNVVVLSVPSSVISGDSAGRRQFSDVGSGTGIYATDGVSVQIRWTKSSATSPLKLMNADGTELKLNPGKTFFSYVNGMGQIVVGN